jgi:hypothetical protein
MHTSVDVSWLDGVLRHCVLVKYIFMVSQNFESVKELIYDNAWPLTPFTSFENTVSK